MTKPTTIFVALAEAAGQAGADAVIFDVTQGTRSAIGRKDGVGLPRAIPKEHFAISRTDPRQPVNASNDRYPGGETWVDRLHDPRLNQPWIDVTANSILSGDLPQWTDIQVSHQPETSAHVARPRGRRSVVTPQVMDAMSRVPPEELAAMKEEYMEKRFRASRDVCRKARNAILLGKH